MSTTDAKDADMTDPQSRIFHESTPDEWDETTLLDKPDGTLDDLEPDDATRKTVDDHEADGWDAERAGPKSLEQARENLAARIADPSAPDTDGEYTAYDELDPDAEHDGDELADEIRGQ